MPVVPRDRFVGALRGVDGAALASFVADLEAARYDGASTVEPGDGGGYVVVVETGTGRHRYLVTTGRRVRGDCSDVDAVVTAGRPRLPAGTVHVGPDALYRRTLYAVDRETGRRLAREHLGIPLTVPARSDGTSHESLVGSLPVRTVLPAVVAVLALAGAAALGLGGAVPGGPSDASTGPSGAGGPNASATTPGQDVSPSGGVGEYLPGLGPSGVTDAAALAQVHGDAVSGRSYRLRVRHRGYIPDVVRTVAPDAEAGDGQGQSPWTFHRVIVENRTHYQDRLNSAYETPDPDDDGVVLVVAYRYADGNTEFGFADTGSRSYYTRRRAPSPGGEGVYADMTEEYVERYLATTEGSLATSNWNNGTVYVVYATGRPTSLENAENVTEYEARAAVTENGTVLGMVVRYEVETVTGTRTHEFSFQYDGFDTWTVEEPGWYLDVVSDDTRMDQSDGYAPSNTTTGGNWTAWNGTPTPANPTPVAGTVAVAPA